jgi:pimeloyl-ACP methyl ester carboxylesterase
VAPSLTMIGGSTATAWEERIGMRSERTVERGGQEVDEDRARRQLLAGAPVTERRLELAGVSTAVLEGGDGPPVVLLHGQGGWAGVWLPAIAGLAGAHHVVAPDLPGLGASRATEGPPGAETALAWLGELIDQTCATPPVVAGVSLGGSIAARFAAAHPDRLAGLVLVSMGGLVGKVRLPPRMLLALVRHNLRPSERTALAMLRQVSVDVERARERMGRRWEPFRAYSLALSRSPSVRAANRRLLRELGLPRIPPADLARIAVPTTLIWGRQDRVMPLATAEEASARYGWPLHVVEDAGHFLGMDQPEAFLAALRAALDR